MAEEQKITGIERPSHLAMAAIQLHEMYVELQKTGFSKSEATQIVGYIAASGFMEPPAYPEGPTMVPMSLTFMPFEDLESFDDLLDEEEIPGEEPLED